ncbi:MAG: RsmF rRNA methyltransferase first C-terminal domain-containing protein [Suipraeoptans sp.]
MDLPVSYREKMKEILGDDYSSYIESFDDPNLFGLRVNNLKISTEDFLNISPFELTPIPWIENGFYYDGNKYTPGKHPYYHAGLYYLQEPSAMTPANRLPISEGEKVLDLCAAPGGKATELGVKLHNTGLLVANDISNSRAKGLLKNIEVFGINNVLVLSEDPGQLVERFYEYFDKILLDAPCSGEGMFRKDTKMINSWIERGPNYYSVIQKKLIREALSMLKPGGLLMYSTCTFDICENEDIISSVLKEYDNIELEEISPWYSDFTHGFLNKTVRLFPHTIKGEGHFMALLHKTISTNNNIHVKKNLKTNKISIPNEALEFLNDIKIKFDNTNFTLINDNLLYEPSNSYSKKGLRFLRTGLLLGEIKRKRFEPSQSLATSLRMDQFKRVINLNIDDDRVIKYLKGETLETEASNDNKYYLVCVESYPLGWAKGNNKLLKNKYKSGWRLMP